MDVATVRAEVRLVPIHTCSSCGRRERGTTTGCRCATDSIEDLIATLQRMRPSAHDMPVHWSSSVKNGATIFTCGECLSRA